MLDNIHPFIPDSVLPSAVTPLILVIGGYMASHYDALIILFGRTIPALIAGYFNS